MHSVKPDVGAADIMGIPRDPSSDPVVGEPVSNSNPPLDPAVGAAEPRGSPLLPSALVGDAVSNSKPPLDPAVGAAEPRGSPLLPSAAVGEEVSKPLRPGEGDGVSNPVDRDVGEAVSTATAVVGEDVSRPRDPSVPVPAEREGAAVLAERVGAGDSVSCFRFVFVAAAREVAVISRREKRKKHVLHLLQTALSSRRNTFELALASHTGCAGQAREPGEFVCQPRRGYFS